MAVTRQTVTGLIFTFPAYTPSVKQTHPASPGASHKTLIIATCAGAGGFLIALIFVISWICMQRRKRRRQNRSSIVLHRWLATKERNGLFISRPICREEGVEDDKQEVYHKEHAGTWIAALPFGNRQIPRKPAPALTPSFKTPTSIVYRIDGEHARYEGDIESGQSYSPQGNYSISALPASSRLPSTVSPSVPSIAPSATMRRNTFASIRTAVSRASRATSKRSVPAEQQDTTEAARASSLLDLRISLYPTTPTSPGQSFPRQPSQATSPQSVVSFAVPDWQYQHFPIDGAAKARMAGAGL